jgi:hypothetical protein
MPKMAIESSGRSARRRSSDPSMCGDSRRDAHHYGNIPPIVSARAHELRFVTDYHLT